jgi:hypothetical protein
MTHSIQNKFNFPLLKCGGISILLGLLIGSLISGVSVYNYIHIDMDKNYVQLHNTNIGYMVFKDDKVYNLSELKSLN